MSFIAQLEQVFRLTALGWKVYPVSRPDYQGKDPGKSPWCPHGHNDATADYATIMRWSADKPGCNWGVRPCDGCCVLDVDARHGGLEALADLEARHGPLPSTPCVRSGGGGKHYYLACPAGFQVKAKIAACEGLELIAAKGGVIIPPSVHAKTGRAYEWITPPWSLPLATAPAWLLDLATEANAQAEALDLDTLVCGSGEGPDFATLGLVPEHRRNGILCEVIGRHLNRQEDEEAVLEQALAWAEQQEPPYDAEEMRRKVKSLARKKAGQQTPPPLPDKAPASRTRVSITEDRSDSLAVGKEGNKPLALSATSFLPSQAEAKVEPLAPTEILPSFPGPGEQEGCGGFVVPQWPTLREEAYQGLFGEIVKSVMPETEVDPAGILVSLLVGFGSAVGRGPSFQVGKGKHCPNLFAVLVAQTGIGKGDAWEIAFDLLAKADPEWAINCLVTGMGSGEGLVDRVRDEVVESRPVKGEDGTLSGFQQVVLESGVEDKRLFCVEEEFIKPLALMRREDSTLSAHIRNAWGGRPLEVLNRKKNRIKATDAHISILGHITPEELLKALAGGVETKNGFLNRFLLCCVRRTKLLPDGGNAEVIDRFAEPLAAALAKAKTISAMSRSEEAGRLWHEVYARLAECHSVATERARPQVLRLSMVYALADGSSEVSLTHLRAALALWDYCEASARLLFPQNNKPQPPKQEKEPLWLGLLKAIDQRPGVSRSDLLRDFRAATAKELGEAFAWLEAHGSAHRRAVESGGRPAECWFPGPAPSPADPGGKEGKNSVVQADTKNDGKEGKNPGEAVPPSFLPSAEQESDQPGGIGVVVPRQAHVHEPEGGVGVRGEPAPTYWPRTGPTWRREGTELVGQMHHDADAPPGPPPDHGEDDDFLSRLDADPVAELLPTAGE